MVSVLREITLELADGEMTAIMGPSGSGKSTLMNVLGLLDRPSSGRYCLADRDVGRLDEEERAGLRNRKLGFVFQTFNLLQRNTAVENVELPLVYGGLGKAARRLKAQVALDSVGLSHRQNHWPHQLSGGEQQRVAIARALVNDPSLILADEPTGALDARTSYEILALFQALNCKGRTIVVVTHDREVSQHADRILYLRDGCLVGDERVGEPVNAAARRAAASSDVISNEALTPLSNSNGAEP